MTTPAALMLDDTDGRRTVTPLSASRSGVWAVGWADLAVEVWVDLPPED